jgi:hypothetical protein
MSQKYVPSPNFQGPANPKAQVDRPEMAIVRVARDQFESAKRETKIKANTAAMYWKAWQDSLQRVGPGGDPNLKRVAEIEIMLYKRQVESIVKPAAQKYAIAIANAIKAGCTSVGGSFSHEDVLKRLLSLDADSCSVGDDTLFLSQINMPEVIDKVAQNALILCNFNSDARGISLGVMCLNLAEIYNAQDYNWVKKLREYINNLYT